MEVFNLYKIGFIKEMLCDDFHNSCITFSFFRLEWKPMKLKYKCEICNKPQDSAPKFELHVETDHPEIGKILYFEKYLLKTKDEKFGKCLVCGKPLSTEGKRFSFLYENGFRRHVHRQCSQPTKEHWILMFGEKEGIEKWNRYCELQSKSNTFEYKQQKYGWTKEEFDNYNRSRAVTLKNLTEKYGKEEAEKRFKSYCEKQSYAGCKLDYFIEKYGEQEGTKRYNELNKRKALTLDNLINVYGETLGKEKYFELKTKEHNFYSKISKELFDKLQIKFPNRKFYYVDNEFGLYDEINKKYNKYDFTDNVNKLIIEFNGEHFHAKSPDDLTFYNPYKPELTAQEQFQFDETKKMCAKRKGYKIYYIWENEYINNTNKIIENCISFLNMEE